MKVNINYKYTNAGYKEIPYDFETEEALNEFLTKQTDEGIRKIIGISRLT